MTLDQKQKQFWNRHAKRNKNPRDSNVSVLLGAFVSRSSIQPVKGIIAKSYVIFFTKYTLSGKEYCNSYFAVFHCKVIENAV